MTHTTLHQCFFCITFMTIGQIKKKQQKKTLFDIIICELLFQSKNTLIYIIYKKVKYCPVCEIFEEYCGFYKFTEQCNYLIKLNMLINGNQS